MINEGEHVRLVHVTTIPESLYFLRGQVGYMQSRGLMVTAISSLGEALERFGAQESVPVYAVAMSRRITPLADFNSLLSIYRKLRQIRPHILHAHTPKAGLLATTAARLARVPVRVYHIHGLPLTTAVGAKRAVLKNSEKMACRLATQVLCVSHSVRDVVVSEKLCSPGRIKVLGRGSINGVDAAGAFNPSNHTAARAQLRRQYDIPDSALVVAYIGRIIRDKGMVELAQCWEMLRDRLPELHLLIVGPFEPQDPVPDEVEQMLRFDDRIHLAGLQWDVAPYYAASDIVVLPTYREGFPTVPLEAAAMELPVVATAVPGCIDAVQDGVTGCIVTPRNATALADALSRYAEDPQLRRDHGQAGRERVLRDYCPHDLWESMYEEYLRCLCAAGLLMPDKPYVEA